MTKALGEGEGRPPRPRLPLPVLLCAGQGRRLQVVKEAFTTPFSTSGGALAGDALVIAGAAARAVGDRRVVLEAEPFIENRLSELIAEGRSAFQDGLAVKGGHQRHNQARPRRRE